MLIIRGRTASLDSLPARREGCRDFEMLPVEIEQFGAREGARKRHLSTSISRHSNLAVFKRAHAKANGRMECEACRFAGLSAYGEAIDCCFEVHHKRHLHKGERITAMEDLALVCANCHNAIHGLGDIEFDAFLKRFHPERAGKVDFFLEPP
ncbi:MAG: hypothetical protein E7774_03100 [Bradyrhizobium sp.]|nr:MAG: hypothetical protein E7774_03100 [Bradyrhizobium sp.]